MRPRLRDVRRAHHRRSQPGRRQSRAPDAVHDRSTRRKSMTSVAPTVADISVPPPTEPPKSRFTLNLRQSGIYIAFALIIVLFAALTGGDLLEPQNISNIIVQNSYILILAIGMILIIIAGHIDLSAGSVVAVTGAISAVLMVNLHWPWPVAIL